MTETDTIRRMPNFWTRYRERLIAAAVWIVLLGAYITYSVVNQLSPMEAARSLFDLIGSSAIGPLIFIAIYTVRPLIFFSSAVLTLAAGFLFGPVWGFVYALTGSSLSSVLAYAIGYFFGENILDDNDEQSFIQRYASRMRQNSFETVLLMRFLFLPFDLVSYLAGFLRIDLKAFLLASILGSIPGGFSVALAGASGGFSEDGLALDPWTLGLAAALFLFSLLLSRFLRSRESAGQETTQ